MSLAIDHKLPMEQDNQSDSRTPSSATTNKLRLKQAHPFYNIVEPFTISSSLNRMDQVNGYS